MRLLLLILFVSAVFAEEKKAAKPTESKKIIDTKDVKKPAEETVKSKTEKRDSSDQTGSFATNPNDEPFRPIIGIDNTDIYEAAAATQQATYYDKNQLTTNDGGGSQQQRQHQKQQQQQQQQQFTAHDGLPAKDETINRQAPSAAYQRPYSQVIYQQQQQQEQQQQQQKQFIRVAAKNNGIQQKDIPYASPLNAAYNYERLPVQYLHQQQQLQQQQPGRGPHQQRPQPVQYVIAIPMSYLRQLQQQLQQQQQQQQPSHLQPHNAQQPQQSHVIAAQPAYSIAGPLARDHQGTYRPFHRFGPTAANDVQANTAAGQQQQQQQPHQHAAAPPGYITQYIQIPASALLAAAQSAQFYQRPTPQQVAYQQQQEQQQQQQSQPPQLYYQPYQPPQQHEHQGQQQQQQLKHSSASQVATSPPLYAYQIQEQQPAQPAQQQHQQQAAATAGVVHIQVQAVPQQLQHNQASGGASENPNLAPTTAYQHGPLIPYEQPKQALQQTHTHPHSQQAHNHQEPAQVLTVPQEPAQKTVHAIPSQSAPPAPGHSYQPVVHYNPEYLVQYIQPQQQKHLKYAQSQPQPQLQLQHLHLNPHLHPHQHRLQLQPAPQQPTTIVQHLNSFPFHHSQGGGIHGPTPVPSFVRLPGVAPGVHIGSPFFHHPLVSSALQPAFAPLGIPSKVTSFTNVLLQPFGHGHGASYETTPDIGAASNALPYFNHAGGIHYGSHLFHPPTPATPIVNKQPHHAVASAVVTSGAGIRASAKAPATATAKAATVLQAAAVEGSRTIVKYP